MPNLRELFNEINSLNDIFRIRNSFKNKDGESSFFELKGTKNNKFDTDSKKLISKEFSALTNTYGGIVVFHLTDNKN